MIHLTPADYRVQPWKNGRGTTTELWRHEVDGQLLVRLSRASVVEDGPFSLFPGIERNLTVLSGTGFRMIGEGQSFRCDPLVPVGFSGDLALCATETGGQASEDFNVMTARALPKPDVRVVRNATLPADGILALYALAPCRVNDTETARDDLVLTEGQADIISDGPILAVRIRGLKPGLFAGKS
jgi:uncharacterized protein